MSIVHGPHTYSCIQNGGFKVGKKVDNIAGSKLGNLSPEALDVRF